MELCVSQDRGCFSHSKRGSQYQSYWRVPNATRPEPNSLGAVAIDCHRPTLLGNRWAIRKRHCLLILLRFSLCFYCYSPSVSISHSSGRLGLTFLFLFRISRIDCLWYRRVFVLCGYISDAMDYSILRFSSRSVRIYGFLKRRDCIQPDTSHIYSCNPLRFCVCVCGYYHQSWARKKCAVVSHDLAFVYLHW